MVRDALKKTAAAAGPGALGRWLACCLVLTTLGGSSPAAVVSVRDSGAGCDYMSGEPITLPAASLSPNLFRNGAQVIRNRLHTARPVVLDSMGRLEYMKGEPVPPVAVGGTNLPGNGAHLAPPAAPGGGADGLESAPATSRFPAYLEGQQYVWFLQDVRHYTNYSCTVTVDCPSTFYLLVDNRVNDYAPESSYDDPSFGPPDTQWVLDDGWKRVNTGLTPVVTPTCAGDYIGIDEGNNGTINQVYSVYVRTLSKPGSITLGTEFDGNIYCLVVSTNPVPLTKAVRQPTTKQAASPKQTLVSAVLAFPRPLGR
jgi:hypothetical protein